MSGEGRNTDDMVMRKTHSPSSAKAVKLSFIAHILTTALLK
jgi:hypothetical protein